jgi:hypothetical protein
MVLKPRFWGFWTAVAFAVFFLAMGVALYSDGDRVGDLSDATGQAIFAGLVTLLGALAYRSAKRRKLSDPAPRRWHRPLELACILAPLLFIATQDDPFAVIQMRPMIPIVASWTILAYVAAATGTTQPRARPVLRRTLVIVAVALAAYAAAGWYQNRQLTTVMSRPWPLLGDGIVSIPSRFPARRKTAAAFEAEKIASSLGVSMRPRDPGPESEDRKRFEAVRGALSDYITGALIQSTKYVGLPPDELAQYLDSNRKALDDLRDLLLRDAPLGWDVDVTDTRYSSSPALNWAGHASLNRLLIASALSAVARGEDERASTFLHAAMNWSASLRRRPELLSTLVYFSESRDVAASVLKLHAPYPDWFVKRPHGDMHVLLSESLAYENWLVVRLMRQSPRFRLDDGSGHRSFRFDLYGVWRWILRPVLLQSQRHTIDWERVTLEELFSNADCTIGLAPSSGRWWRQSQMWLSYGFFFGESSPNIHLHWSRAQNSRLASELASIVTATETHAAARSRLSSEACRALSWIVDAGEDGSSSVRLVSAASLRNGAGPSHPVILESFIVPSLEHAAGPAALRAAPGSVQIVQNGGFEDAPSGKRHDWSLDDPAPVDTPGRSPGRQPDGGSVAGADAHAAHQGQWFLLLYSVNGKETDVSQSVRIPDDGTTALLTFWLRVDPANPPSMTGLQDALQIRLAMIGEPNATLDVIPGRNVISGSYQRRSYRFNVAAWRKGNMSLQFVIPAPPPGTPAPATAFLLDDVTLEVQP